jgi:hypothetical protein
MVAARKRYSTTPPRGHAVGYVDGEAKIDIEPHMQRVYHFRLVVRPRLMLLG